MKLGVHQFALAGALLSGVFFFLLALLGYFSAAQTAGAEQSFVKIIVIAPVLTALFTYVYNSVFAVVYNRLP